MAAFTMSLTIMPLVLGSLTFELKDELSRSRPFTKRTCRINTFIAGTAQSTMT